MHLAPLIQDLAVILIVAAIVGSLFRRLRLPVVVGYLLAGAFLGPNSLLSSAVTDLPNLRVWAELGVVFLMFHLGLEFSFRRLQKLGASTLVVGFLEVSLMLGIGFLASGIFGFHGIARWMTAAMIAISSTTIIVKALEDAGLKNKRFSERVFGILIVEDLIAVLAIVALSSSLEARTFAGSQVFYLLGELVIVIGGWYLIGGMIVPRILKPVAKMQNDELMIVTALGLCLLLAVVASRFDYSLALGAFIMGSIIAESQEAARIQRLVHPLRDVFAAVFFVSIGMLADFRIFTEHAGLILFASFLIIGGKFFAVTFSSLIAGIRFPSAVRMGLSMGQIGEFSFIIAGLGLARGQLSISVGSGVVIVALITSFTTPFFVKQSESWARILEGAINPRWLRSWDHYAEKVRTLKDGRIFPRWLMPGITRLLLNALLVGLITGAFRRFALSPIEMVVGDTWLANAAGFLIAIVLSAPFIYAMLTASGFKSLSNLTEQKPSEPASHAAARAFFFLLFTILWIGVLSTQYLPPATSAFVTISLSTLLLAILFKKMKSSYEWLEHRYLSGLRAEIEESEASKTLKGLAPWDAHLVRLTVHANAPITGLSLAAAGLRYRFNLIVIAIGRGEKVIPTPEASEILFPHDELLVLGLDEDIDRGRDEIELPVHKFASDASGRMPSNALSEYEMRILKIGSDSGFCGRTLKESRLRETYGSLVVGIEKQGRRILTPRPETPLEAGDQIWVVGQRELINSL